MLLTHRFIDRLIDRVDTCPWPTLAGHATFDHAPAFTSRPAPSKSNLLYTPEQRRRRDNTIWTQVQGVLAPIQFLVFLVSLALVINFLATGDNEGAATASIVVKTLVLYTIMVTGAIWEKKVYGQYLLAPAFFWEDVVSFLVLALHTAYLYALWTNALSIEAQMYLALAAYTAYVVNATQFVLKLRAARLSKPLEMIGSAL